MNWLEMSVAQRDDYIREVLQQGEDAQQSGGLVNQCPYPLHTQKATWWRRGFMNAEMGSKIKA